MNKDLKKLTDEELFDELDEDNDTGFATEDLVKIVKQHIGGEWSKPMTAEELIEYLEGLFKNSQK